MLRVLRELEGNAFALLLALFAFLFLLLIVAIVANVLFGVDWNAVLGIAGMGTGGTVNGHVNQMLSARSPNYQPPSAIAAGVLPANAVQGGGSGPVGMG